MRFRILHQLMALSRMLFYVQPYMKDGNTEHGSYKFRQTNFKDFSTIFQGQITVFKD